MTTQSVPEAWVLTTWHAWLSSTRSHVNPARPAHFTFDIRRFFLTWMAPLYTLHCLHLSPLVRFVALSIHLIDATRKTHVHCNFALKFAHPFLICDHGRQPRSSGRWSCWFVPGSVFDICVVAMLLQTRHRALLWARGLPLYNNTGSSTFCGLGVQLT